MNNSTPHTTKQIRKYIKYKQWKWQPPKNWESTVTLFGYVQFNLKIKYDGK